VQTRSRINQEEFNFDFEIEYEQIKIVRKKRSK